MTPIVSIKDLNMHYGRSHVLKDVSFEINQGDYIAIVGPNGSGKSTLIKGMLGLMKPTSGIIQFHPQELVRQIGYLPQQVRPRDPLFPASVREIISIGLLGRNKHRPDKKDHASIQRIMEKLSIDHLADKRIGDLSGGQQQRVLLARSLVSNPQILILDEPTSALDPAIREVFYDLIDEQNKKEGVTVLLVTHDVSSVGRYTSKILYLDRELVFYGDYESFCHSEDMGQYFGVQSQHQFCWRHHD